MKYLLPFLLLVPFYKRKKEPCPIDNTGRICVTNSTSLILFVNLNNTIALAINPEGIRCAFIQAGVVDLTATNDQNEFFVEEIVLGECEEYPLEVRQ